MEEEIKDLQNIIAQKNKELADLKSQLEEKNRHVSNVIVSSKSPNVLSQNEIARYSRQLILPEIGMSGQLSLKKTAVLIVGAGGLGCPVGIYLAAAGVGRIGIVDHDVVDISNLHRQIAHTITSVGQEKCKSLMNTLLEINPDIECTAYPTLLNSTNIEKIIESYNIIVDASDNVPTRYLLNDAAVLLGKYLVSGSALRFEGQLTVYNYLDGPCYRCLYPTPPNADAITNCSEGGVIGAVTGVIGSLQALEVIKIAVGLEPSYYKKLLLYDGLSADIKVIKLRSKKTDCAVCGDQPTIKELVDYEVFCNTSATDKNENVLILAENERISCTEYKKIVDGRKCHILVDVRPSIERSICCLPNSINIPLNDIQRDVSLLQLRNLIEEKECKDNFVVCRRGNDSQKAVRKLQESLPDCVWRDIKGGLYSWHDEIDSSFPLY